MRLIKLVRNKVGDNNDQVYYKAMGRGRTEFTRALRSKLIEEAIEYKSDPRLNELIDVFEVIRELARTDHLLKFDQFVDLADRVREEKGGFSEHIGLFIHRQEEE